MKKMGYLLVLILDRLCCLTHPFAEIEIKLTGRHCNICLLAGWLDDKYNLGFWQPITGETMDKENETDCQ